jgi:uncharacterized membrane protein
LPVKQGEIQMAINNRNKNVVPKLKKDNIKNDVIHKSFEIGMLLKGIDGVLEIIGEILYSTLI